MIAAHLPRAVADGGDREARSQMLLASHLAGVASPAPALASAMPSATRSAGGSTSPTAWR